MMRGTDIPVIGPPPPVRVPRASRTRLGNGLLIRVVERPRLPIVDALLVLPAGASAAPPATAGLTSLTTELLDSGTPTRSQSAIAAAFDALGARVSAQAQWDFCALALQALPDRFAETLAIAAELVSDAVFPAAEFERGRSERLARIRQDLEAPDVLADSAIARSIFGADHIYGTPRYGSASTVGRVDRNALVRCHRARYRPAGAILVVAGDVTEDNAVGAAEAAFGAWAAGPEPVANPLPGSSRGPTSVRLVDRPGAPQSEIRLGTVGASRTSKDYFPLVVLNTVLGGSFTSRLNTRLRERGGYTYGAFSAFSFRRQPGLFVAGAAVFADATARAVAETLDEIERIRSEPASDSELERAKRYLTLGVPRGFEANDGIAARIAETELHGLGDDWWDGHAARVNEVGAAAVVEVGRKYLDPARLEIVVVGDAGRTRESLESLGAGPVTETTLD